MITVRRIDHRPRQARGDRSGGAHAAAVMIRHETCRTAESHDRSHDSHRRQVTQVTGPVLRNVVTFSLGLRNYTQAFSVHFPYETATRNAGRLYSILLHHSTLLVIMITSMQYAARHGTDESDQAMWRVDKRKKKKRKKKTKQIHFCCLMAVFSIIMIS